MELKLDQILDVQLLQSLQEKLNAINTFPSALIDNEGRILTATAWQEVCTRFHRANPDSEKQCITSDQYILSHINGDSPAVTYRCPHGLVDNVIPIMVDGRQLGGFFTGQLFLEAPDLDHFRAQAKQYGYDEEAYIEAVLKVPVWSREQLNQYLLFMKTFTESLAEMGINRFQGSEAKRLAQESEKRFRTIIEDTRAGYFYIDKDGIFRDVNNSWVNLYKYDSRDEIIGHHFAEVQRFEDRAKAMNFVDRILEGDPSYLSGEFSRRCKDGTTGYHSFSARPVMSEGVAIGIEGFIIDSTRQKLAELERDVTRLRLSSVFDKMIEGFALHEIICDADGKPVDYRFIDVNPAFEQMTGFTAGQVVGYTAREIFSNLEDCWIERYGAVALTGEPVTFEDYTGAQDKYFRVVAFSNQKGQFATVFNDITDRVNAENELRDSEAKYRQLADLTPEGLLIHLDGAVKYANRSAARILKAPDPEWLIGKKITDFVHPAFRAKVKTRINRIVERLDSAPVIVEKLLRTDGEEFYSEVSAVPFKLSGRSAVQVVFNDITERRIAEEKMRILAQAIDSIKECVSMTDVNNTVIFINKAFCNTYGYTQEELVGQDISIVNSPLEASAISKDILKETLRGGWSGEVWNRRKDGSDLPVHLSTAIVSDDGDEPIALIGIAVDITERKKNETDLIAAKEKAEESDRLKSAFLANISHEIRTPMNSILGFSEILEDMVEDPKQQEYLRVISRGGERLLNIINSVIDIAKIEAGQANPSASDFEINELMTELFELNRQRNPGVEFMLYPPLNGPVILHTDKTKLFQILNNLLSNALKFTHNGSVKFGYKKDPDHVVFHVTDTGIGIPEEFRYKIFERFRKVDLQGRSDYEGTGLGLAITKELVRILNGEIWFESIPEQGTSFFVKFPH
jgi:PAS domain S-box-containing protein